MSHPDLTSARVLADSVDEFTECNRIITVEVTYPRIIHSEVLTHRGLSRNSASSRAIPIERQIQRIQEHPFVPQRFPINRPGMSADQYHEPGSDGHGECEFWWLAARDDALHCAEQLLRHGVHKQIANRLLEPFMWHTVIATGTMRTWRGFFELRISSAAQPEICTAATAIRTAISQSSPAPIAGDGWHLPLIDPDEQLMCSDIELALVSASRCARVSYDRHNDAEPVAKSLERAYSLARNGHLSPFEHVATPWPNSEDWANLHGWKQLRLGIERGTHLEAMAAAASS